MKDLGLDTYRFSVSWSRVRPTAVGQPEGPRLLQAPRRRTARERHPALADALPLGPAAGDRGARRLDRAFDGEQFAEYALDVHDALGDRVAELDDAQRAVVLVVPELHRRHPRAGRYSVTDGVLAAHHLLLGHGLAVRSCARATPR
jgi:beta-glucosidase